jgi:hypothetical protein
MENKGKEKSNEEAQGKREQSNLSSPVQTRRNLPWSLVSTAVAKTCFAAAKKMDSKRFESESDWDDMRKRTWVRMAPSVL